MATESSLESSSSEKNNHATSSEFCDRNVEGAENRESQQECFFNQLSDDLVLNISEYLDIRDLVTLQSVNKRLYNVSSTPSLWKRLYPSVKEYHWFTKVYPDPKEIERLTQAGMNEWKAACVEVFSVPRGRDKAQTLKLMAVGDSTVGKTSTFSAYAANTKKEKFGLKREPTGTNVLFRGKDIRLEFWDVSGGGESYGRLRPVSYPGTDVFLLLYSCVSPSSIANVTSRWYPEITHHCPNVPIVLAATKHDLKDNSEEQKNSSIVTPDQGKKLAQDLNCYSFIEYSSITQYNLDKVFEICLEAATTQVTAFTPQKKKREKCRLM